MDTTERHPRWAGVLLSFFLPGAGQYFAGAKRRGLIWLAVMFLWPGVVLFVLSQPNIPGMMAGWAALALWAALWLWMLAEAWRPVEKLDGITWATLVLCGIGLLLLEQSLWMKYCAELFFVPNSGIPVAATNAPGLQARSDLVVAQKYAYWFSEPKRGDMVVFKTDDVSDLLGKGRMTLRIAGLPGERVSLPNGKLVINGQPVATPAIFTKLRYGTPPEATLFNNPLSSFVVPAGHYFLLGDQSAISCDSRFWGPVARHHIMGRVTRICWPAARSKVLD